MRRIPLITSDRFAPFVFRTRGVYMLIALIASILLKARAHGTTPSALLVTSIVITALVQFFRVYAASYLWGRQAVMKPQADFFCTSGPYAYLRNPMYLGNFFIGIALCIAINELYAYVLFIVSYIFVYSIVIPYEERFLQRKFENSYTVYKSHTGRLLPRLKAYQGNTRVIPDFKAGFMGEVHVPLLLAIIYLIILLVK